jgi:23S rRNA pseudouridine1911/1915/1917 synthase
MSKHIDTTILAVLRQYEIAGELSGKKSIKEIKEYPERQLSRLITFVFERERYALLFDSSAKDDVALVRDHIELDIPDLQGQLVRNPKEGSIQAYGMPYRGKDVYLYRMSLRKVRLDQELSHRYADISRSTIQKYIKAGYVHVNGVVITSTKHEVKETDELAMTPPTATDFSEQTLPIVYIDDAVIVINKPAGILAHSKGVMNDEFTVADFFRRYTNAGLDTNRPGIVHRLDRDTSGIMIGARTPEAALRLKKQFADRSTKKIYHAVVMGHPKQAEAVIDLPIGRKPSAPSTFQVDSKGKEAQTTYKVLEAGEKYSLVELKPRTGRTHQLRVHMSYIGTPILGDTVYANAKRGDRLFLHAAQLEITITDGKRVVFTAPTPDQFHTTVQGL